MTAYIIVALVALSLGGFGGGWVVSSAKKAEIAESQSEAQQAEARAHELEAAAATTEAAGDLVKAAVSEHLAKVGLQSDILSIDRAKFLCAGDYANEPACVAYLLCAQVAGGTVQPSACDAAINQWVSERQIEVVEEAPTAGEADPTRRDERRRMLEKRK